MENNPLAEYSECTIRNAVSRLKGLQNVVGAGELNGDLGMAIQALDYFRGLAAEMEQETLIKNGVKRLFPTNTVVEHPYEFVRYVLENFAGKTLYIVTSADRRNRRLWENLFDVAEYAGDIVVTSWHSIENLLDVTGAFFVFDGDYVCGNSKWAVDFAKIAKKNDWVAIADYIGRDWINLSCLFTAAGFFKNRAEYIKKHIVFDESCPFPKVKAVKDLERLVHMLESIVLRDFANPLPCLTESDPA